MNHSGIALSSAQWAPYECGPTSNLVSILIVWNIWQRFGYFCELTLRSHRNNIHEMENVIFSFSVIGSKMSSFRKGNVKLVSSLHDEFWTRIFIQGANLVWNFASPPEKRNSKWKSPISIAPQDIACLQDPAPCKKTPVIELRRSSSSIGHITSSTAQNAIPVNAQAKTKQ